MSTSFGGRKNGGLCEIYRETAKDVILDMLRRTSMLSQLQMNEARKEMDKKRKRQSSRSGASKRVRKKPAAVVVVHGAANFSM